VTGVPVGRALLALAIGCFLGAAGLAAAGARVSPVAFFLLLGVEALFILGTRAPHRRLAAASRIAVFVAPLALALALRAWIAFTTPGVLEWDETYYLSAAVTAADGRGLYPYVFGYGEMPILGGLGYTAYAYAAAVIAAGPSIFALRAMSLAASLVALVCLWLLVRRLYGSGAAWMAVALVPTLSLFVMSNSARPDSIAFAWVTGSLLLVTLAFQRDSRRWHFLAGLAFGLGLQAHLDTIVTAAACGVLYLVAWFRGRHARGGLGVPSAMLLYVAGWSVGLAVFVLGNILPDPDAFYRTTVLIRVDATNWYSEGTSSTIGSFLDPRVLVAKEIERYSLLVRGVHWIEIGLAGLALAAAAARRQRVDLALLIVAGAVVAIAAVVLNNASPLYFIHVTPALMLPLAPVFSHGFSGRGPVPVTALGTGRLLAFAVVISALCAVNSVRPVWAAGPDATPADVADLVARARSAVGRDCRIAGDGRLYVRYFGDYPYFVSARPTEVSYAMIFHGLEREADYWEARRPEAVVMRPPLPAGLTAYIGTQGLEPRGDGLWLAPGSCEGRAEPGLSPRRSTRNGTSRAP
jgi:hypothetical protein